MSTEDLAEMYAAGLRAEAAAAVRAHVNEQIRDRASVPTRLARMTRTEANEDTGPASGRGSDGGSRGEPVAQDREDTNARANAWLRGEYMED